MSRKSGLEIKKAILNILKQKEASLRELETKINTNYQTIRRHCKELEFFKLIEIKEHGKSDANGRPYRTARITDFGRKIGQN